MSSEVKEQKLGYIDAIRGIAILMVVIHHSAQQGVVKMPHGLSVLLSLGTRGVQLFFVVSAFTLFRSFKRRKLAEKRPIENFFIRRFFRIAPLYYLAILYYLCVMFFDIPYWLGEQAFISTNNLLSNMLFLHGFSPYWINSLVPGGWSIAVEMLFYVFFPFIFSRIKNINHALIFLNCSLIIKIIIQEFFMQFPVISSSYLWREFMFYYFPSQLPIFALGFILFFLIEDTRSVKLLSSKALIFFLILLSLQVGSKMDFLYLNHILFGIIFVMFSVFMSKESWNFVTNAFLKYIGEISFSIYITHFIVIAWLSKFKMLNFSEHYAIDFSIRFALILSISVLVSIVTYKLIEIPFQNLAKSIILKLENNRMVSLRKK